MSQFIGIDMPRGYAGEITRGYFDYTTEVKANDATTPVTAFGVPVMLNTAKTAVVLGTTAANIIGFSVRDYGQADAAGVQQQSIVTVLKRGYFAAAITGGTPAPGGQVYVTSAGVLSAASSGNTAVSGAVFCGSIDAAGLAEIAYNI